MNTLNLDAMFSGVIGQEYDMLKLICPASVESSKLVGMHAAKITEEQGSALKIVELGGGTGITTLSILNACQPSHILSIDNEATMQKQAMAHLSAWVDSGHLSFSLNDALSALQQIDSASVDLVASSYTLHNFRYDYRQNVLREIFRVLKPGGSFVNGDRYALNDKELHTRSIQTEVAHYFKVLKSLDRLDLLESWVLHVLNDESENHLMRESIALEQMLAVGFEGIGFSSRQDVTAVCTAKKIA